ncbi:hypothetical protein BT63DRAFT_415501 [Microthyrium microscopicum]|uniref:BTB domain-containing protein n=1 Tax=Microthyrium microscopicum TaxID=703497 RepID=A0A6A6U737_9PEZI|nr:hypothetical protein BT63DRAFT_415501 [Microthyrium microscopicum]
MSEPSPAKRRKVRQTDSDLQSFAGETIQVLVGASETPFTVQKSILSSNSEYFERMLRNDFKESLEGVSKLPKHTPEAFEIFMNFIYRGNIYSATEAGSQLTGKDKHTAFANEMNKILQAISLANYLQSDGFQNATITALFQCVSDYQLLPTTRKLLDKAVDMNIASLTEVFQDFFVLQGSGGWSAFSEETADPSEADFWKGIAKKAIIELRNREKVNHVIKAVETRDLDPCKYHIHRDGKKCSN